MVKFCPLKKYRDMWNEIFKDAEYVETGVFSEPERGRYAIILRGKKEFVLEAYIILYLRKIKEEEIKDFTRIFDKLIILVRLSRLENWSVHTWRVLRLKGEPWLMVVGYVPWRVTVWEGIEELEWEKHVFIDFETELDNVIKLYRRIERRKKRNDLVDEPFKEGIMVIDDRRDGIDEIPRTRNVDEGKVGKV
ncbi:hypothetical protein [Pyrococcus kukulkanii]|uniref:Uncharacterized protein n=1 Tax=Pyrococcus kukulkanii TaxID=1609559 RepID=A0ABV4T3K4_9EURY